MSDEDKVIAFFLVIIPKKYVRESKWSQSIAFGRKSFVEGIKEKLGIRTKGRKVGEAGGSYHLREAQVPYNSDFPPENSDSTYILLFEKYLCNYWKTF